VGFPGTGRAQQQHAYPTLEKFTEFVDVSLHQFSGTERSESRQKISKGPVAIPHRDFRSDPQVVCPPFFSP
jgi:hypothetical protein